MATFYDRISILNSVSLCRLCFKKKERLIDLRNNLHLNNLVTNILNKRSEKNDMVSYKICRKCKNVIISINSCIQYFTEIDEVMEKFIETGSINPILNIPNTKIQKIKIGSNLSIMNELNFMNTNSPGVTTNNHSTQTICDIQEVDNNNVTKDPIMEVDQDINIDGSLNIYYPDDIDHYFEEEWYNNTLSILVDTHISESANDMCK